MNAADKGQETNDECRMLNDEETTKHELSGDLATLSAKPKWMCQQNEIDGAHQIDEAAGRTR
jgi:hypothetical protein